MLEKGFIGIRSIQNIKSIIQCIPFLYTRIIVIVWMIKCGIIKCFQSIISFTKTEIFIGVNLFLEMGSYIFFVLKKI